MHTRTSVKSNTIAISTILVLFLLFTILKPGEVTTYAVEDIPWDFEENFNHLDLNKWEVVSDPIGQIKSTNNGEYIIGGSGEATITQTGTALEDFSTTAWRYKLKVLKGNEPLDYCYQCPDLSSVGTSKDKITLKIS